MRSSSFNCSLNLRKHFLGRGLQNTKHGVEIRVRPCTHNSKHLRKLLIVNRARVILVVLAEQGIDLIAVEDAAEFVHCRPELLLVDSVAVGEVEVLECLGDCGALVLAFLGLLTDFLVDDGFEFGYALLGDVVSATGDTPRFQHKIHKIVLLLIRQRSIDISIVLKELCLGNALSIAAFPLNSPCELIVHLFSCLVPDSHPGVVLRSEVF